MASEQAYPFVPKSNRYLRPGQFCSIPLRDGYFGAGRVMAVPAFGDTDRTGLVIGLMDWVGHAPPSEDDIAGRPVIMQAQTRFDAISKTGGEVLGSRPLALDGLEAIDPYDFRVGSRQRVWGWATIVKHAEQLLPEKQ